MLIKKLVLHKYKRLMLNNIGHIEVTPQNIYQLILGTNGSGKSSLLKEASPLPAIRNNFNKGGYKEIQLEFDGYLYKLTSDFSKGNNHFFLRQPINVQSDDWEDLNPGNTISVQKELVESIFNITPMIHELMTGETPFTEMVPNKRREWITKVSDVDFTYAIGVFKSLKTKARDLQGALKHSKGRITGETNRLMAIGDLELIEDEYNRLHNEITILIGSKDNDISPQGYISQIEAGLADIDKLSRTILKTNLVNPSIENFKSLEDLDNHINGLKTSVGVKQGDKATLTSQLLDYQDILKDSKDIGDLDSGSLNVELVGLKNKRHKLFESLRMYREFKSDASIAFNSLSECIDSICSILGIMESDPDNQYDKLKIEKAREKLTDLKSKENRLANAISSRQSKLDHLLSLKEETCPKCNHVWVPGISDTEQKLLEQDLTKFTTLHEQFVNDIKGLNSYLELAEEYSGHLYRLRSYTHKYPELDVLWGEILLTDALKENPKGIINSIYLFKDDLLIHKEKQSLEERIKYLESLLKDEAGLGHLKQIKERVGALEARIETLTKEIIDDEERVRLFTTYRNNIYKIYQLNESLDKTLENLKVYRENQVKYIRNTLIEKNLVEHQNRMSVVRAKQSEKQTLEGIIADLKRDVINLERDESIYTALAKELSPVDGLIAEQMKGFINGIVKHVNQIISKVWTYDLEVIPCGTENGDLDYRFPLLIRSNGVENITPDISKGSEAQVEMINQAFRLVFMSYLRLEGYPIYLDEFGGAFDEQHRMNAVEFIKYLGETNSYSQIFLISHYMAQFGAIQQADILVLDESNIHIPQAHNLHVKFE